MSNGIPPRYVPTGKILTGGTGEVLICQDTSLERDVAIKFIQNVENQRRLFDEIAALQKIRSKHVVQIFDVFLNEVDRRIGIVQEYISGGDLVSFAERGSISLNEYLKVIYQIASGISDIHAQGLIHRDVKPNNIKFDVISHSNKGGLMRKPPEPQDYSGKSAGGEHPDEAMSSKRWSTAFLP